MRLLPQQTARYLRLLPLALACVALDVLAAPSPAAAGVDSVARSGSVHATATAARLDATHGRRVKPDATRHHARDAAHPRSRSERPAPAHTAHPPPPVHKSRNHGRLSLRHASLLV